MLTYLKYLWCLLISHKLAVRRAGLALAEVSCKRCQRKYCYSAGFQSIIPWDHAWEMFATKNRWELGDSFLLLKKRVCDRS